MAKTVNSPHEPTGEQLRDEGVTAALDADRAPHRDLRAEIARVLDTFVAAGEPFTADDVRDALPDDVQQRAAPNLLSATFSHYARSGRIASVGWTTSSRPSRHQGVIRRWVGASGSIPHPREP